jgi:hypothetical protein
MGTTFPNLTNFVLETETNDIEFLKEFLNGIPEMFPNLKYLKFEFDPRNQETQDLVVLTCNWVKHLKFSSLPKLRITTGYTTYSFAEQ